MADANPGDADGAPKSDPQPTSLTLLDKLRRKQPDAWARFNPLYGPLVNYWCGRRGIRSPQSEDVCQEVFQVVFEKLTKFRRDRPDDTFRGWLYGITKLLILKHLRAAAREPEGQGGTDAGRRFQEVPDPALDDEDDPETERAALLHRALGLIRQEFSERDWHVFTLTVIENQTAPDVAARLQITAAAVRQAKSRMLRRLNEELGEV